MTSMTLSGLLRRSAERFPDRLVITSHDGLRTRGVTFWELWLRSEAIAACLLEDHALQTGDRVIVIAPSGATTVAFIFALFRAGLVAVPLDMNSTSAFLEAVIEKTDARMIYSPDLRKSFDRVTAIGPGSLPLDDRRLAHPIKEPVPEDIAEIVFTSGTTGTPKGVVLTHRNIASDTLAAALMVPDDEALNLVSVLPLSHMYEQVVGLFLPILQGGMIHYVATSRPSAIVNEMRRHAATGMVVVPRFLELLMQGAEARMRERGLGWLWRLQNRIAGRLPFSVRRWVFLRFHSSLGGQLRFFLCGGAALSVETMKAWERTGVRVLEGYGATECAPVIASNSYDDRTPGSAGYPLEGVKVRISDDGELQVSGPNVFSEYWKDTARTKAAFTADGWYCTEDVAEMAADGRLRIVGRLSDRIVLPSGMNVFPSDVEGALSGRSGIAETAVLGLRDETGSERVHALIRPSDGADETLVARSVAAANSILASHQKINGFTLWPDEFPKTPLKKIKRYDLRNSLAEKARARVLPETKGDPVGSIAALLRQVSRHPPEVITEQTLIDTDLGLDSLARVELGNLIERAMGHNISEEVIAGLETVGDLVAEMRKPAPKELNAELPAWPRWGVTRALRSSLQPEFVFLPRWVFARPFLVEGRDTISGIEGPCLFTANHTSHFDTLSIIRALPAERRRMTAVAAAADYFFANRLFAFAAPLVLNAFPFSRRGHITESLEYCGFLADEGWSILIFPEGTRSPDGRLQPFKAGIGLLATGLSVPVVPVAVVGGAKVLPKGKIWPHRAAVTVRFGNPLNIPHELDPIEVTRLLEKSVAGLLPADLLNPRLDEPDDR